MTSRKVERAGANAPAATNARAAVRPARSGAAAGRSRRTNPKRTNAAARAIFIAELALTANVTAAAKKAKLTTAAVYRKRADDAAFRAAWHHALCEGYARLETELLAEALAAPEHDLPDMVVKARQYKQKLALALLAAHRAAVRGERGAPVPAAADETKGAKVRLIETIAAMRRRLAEEGTIAAEGGAE